MVTPLDEDCGMLEWVDNTMGLRPIILNLYKQRNILVAIHASIINNNNLEKKYINLINNTVKNSVNNNNEQMIISMIKH